MKFIKAYEAIICNNDRFHTPRNEYYCNMSQFSEIVEEKSPHGPGKILLKCYVDRRTRYEYVFVNVEDWNKLKV